MIILSVICLVLSFLDLYYARAEVDFLVLLIGLFLLWIGVFINFVVAYTDWKRGKEIDKILAKYKGDARIASLYNEINGK